GEAAANDSGATTVAEVGAGASAVTSGQAADPDRAPVDGDATLSVAPTAVASAEVMVAWTGPGNGSDYIDIVPRGFTEVRGEISYSYVKSADPSVTLRAPTTAGVYDVRYVLELGTERKVKAIAPLTVTAGEATLEAPAAVTGGDAMSVAWTGPDGRGDYIDIV